jgi:multidrug efflux pump subunit AcrB
MDIAQYSIKKKTVTLVLTVAFLVGGILSFLEMPRLEDPEFTIKDALVVTQYPGATPMEVADEVTDVLENAIQQMGQLDTVKSENSAGLSIITVEIKDKYDGKTLPQVWDELRRKINDNAAKLPPGASKPVVIDDFGDVYGIFLSVTGDGYSTKDIQDFAAFLRKQILTVDGVAKVSTWGMQQEAVFIEIPRAKMARLGVTEDALLNALSQRNLVVSSGNVRVGPEYIQITPDGGVESVEDLGELFINDPSSGKLIRIKDIAEIHRDFIDPPSEIMTSDGHPSVALGVSVVSGGNVISMGKAVEARLQELESVTPVGMKISRIYDQPKRVESAVNAFVLNLAEAVGIVIAVLLLFMGMQSGLLIGAILLITISASFIFIQMCGVALERISLGALVIALGMLVDNAIVVVEGLLIRYQQGMNRLESASAVIKQNLWPLLGATIIAIMAFAGIGLSPDSTGEFCKSLFIVIFISLMMSWVTAITITPLFCNMFLHPKKTEGDPYGGKLFTLYKKLLHACLKHRPITLIVLACMLAASIFGFGFVKQSFFPDSTQPRFFIHYWMPQGTDVRTTAAEVEEIAKTIRNDKAVKQVNTFTGSGALRFILTYSPEKSNSSYGMLLVELNDYHDVDRIMAKYKDYVTKNYPASEPKFKKFKLGPGRSASIEVRFSGPDTAVLRSLSKQAEDIMKNTEQAESIRNDWRQPVKIVQPVILEAQSRKAGISRPLLAKTIRQNVSGEKIGVYREGDSLLPIIARPPENERSADNLKNILVTSPVSGKMIPVGQIVSEFKTVFENDKLNTRNRSLTITASCEPTRGLPSVLFKKIRPQIENIPLPQGYKMEWGGEFEDSSKAQKSLGRNLPLPFIIMILITITLFNTLREPLIIWLTVPLAIIGVTFGLLFTGQPFGFMALLGFLSLSGMLIKNSIVLLDQINIELSDGKSPLQAVLDASVSRMRPVCMAAATTILGMLPLVADAFFAAMAVTIMAGLAFATLLTLIIVPVLYTLFHRIERPA